MNWYKKIAIASVIVDLQAKPVPIPAAKKSKINSAIHDLTMNTQDLIPIQQIFDAMTGFGVIAVNEDGTVWDGMLMGTKECGTEGADQQKASIDLAVRLEDGSFAPARSVLYMTWCTKNVPGGARRYETVAYVT